MLSNICLITSKKHLHRKLCKDRTADIKLLEKELPQIEQSSNYLAFLLIKCFCHLMVAVPHGMRFRSDVSFRSHIDRDFADHAETLSRCSNWYVNETDLFEMSSGRLINK